MIGVRADRRKEPVALADAPHLVALVRAGPRFENRKLVERPDESEGEAQVA
jgi:hypothetical protein